MLATATLTRVEFADFSGNTGAEALSFPDQLSLGSVLRKSGINSMRNRFDSHPARQILLYEVIRQSTEMRHALFETLCLQTDTALVITKRSSPHHALRLRPCIHRNAHVFRIFLGDRANVLRDLRQIFIAGFSLVDVVVVISWSIEPGWRLATLRYISRSGSWMRYNSRSV